MNGKFSVRVLSGCKYRLVDKCERSAVSARQQIDGNVYKFDARRKVSVSSPLNDTAVSMKDRTRWGSRRGWLPVLLKRTERANL